MSENPILVVRCFGIKWDTDGASLRSCGLTKTFIVTTYRPEDELDTGIADVLCNKTGYRVVAVDYVVLGTLLRETPHYLAYQRNDGRGVCIRAKAANVLSQQRTVKPSTWNALQRMSDSEFDGSCVLELGIGAIVRNPGKPTDYT